MSKGENHARRDPVTRKDLERYAEAEWQPVRMRAPACRAAATRVKRIDRHPFQYRLAGGRT